MKNSAIFVLGIGIVIAVLILRRDQSQDLPESTQITLGPPAFESSIDLNEPQLLHDGNRQFHETADNDHPLAQRLNQTLGNTEKYNQEYTETFGTAPIVLEPSEPGDPSKEEIEVLVKYGYFEGTAKERSNYQAFDSEMLVEMAEGGDRIAQVFATTRVQIDANKREAFAIRAAAAGYTSGLVRFGLGQAQDRLTTTARNSQLSAASASYGYLQAALELGDPFVSDILMDPRTMGLKITEKEIVSGLEFSQSILKLVTEAETEAIEK